MPAPTATEPASRPSFLPAVRWARWALLFLLVFTLLRGVVWSNTFPAFFGPDEDYHFLYIEHLTTQRALPSPDTKLYPREYPELVKLMRYDNYCCGPRIDFSAFPEPKYAIRESENWPDYYRDPYEVGRGVGVVHPPLYHVVGTAVNAVLGDASVFSRFMAVRWVTSAFGVLAVFCAWLLAAQVFRNETLRLFVAFLVATQPMMGLLSGIANHDMLVIATFTFVSALCLFILREGPRVRQGAWIGGALVLALLTKSTALVLLPLVGLAYAGQALVNRERLRVVARSLGLAAAIVFVGAGWWYLRSFVEYDTITGSVGLGEGAGTPRSDRSLGVVWDLAREWTGYTYRTYWYHHMWPEAPRGSSYFYLPGYIGAVGLAGLALAFHRLRRELLAPERPLLRQIAFLTISALALYLPLLFIDIRNNLNGEGFSMSGGRYLLPAYAAVATLFVVGLRELISRRAQPFVFSLLALVSVWFTWQVWVDAYVRRYYGDKNQGWDTIFRNMSFDRPEFVTGATLRIAIWLIALSLLAAAASVAIGHLPPGAAARLRQRRLPLRRRVPAPTR